VVAHSSGRGQGATFIVTLPLPAARPKLETPEGTSTDRSDGRHTLEGARILVVDDPEFLDLSVMVLRRAGAEVRAVPSAIRAYELIESWLPNVLLIDLAMPREDGFMLAGAMRTIFTQRRAQVSIIAVTA
jgi:PleD family two-component response regulator